MTTQQTAPTPEGSMPSGADKAKATKINSDAVGSEQVVEQELTQEQVAEKAVQEKQSEAAATAAVQAAPTDNAPAAPVVTKSEELIDIEKILSTGIEDLYKELPDNRKQEFRDKGEETARAIEVLMRSAKVKIGKVVKLIADWLKMIPGVNKFFLEQESKIKADNLLQHKKDKEEGKV
jgi:hypothetical protein